MSASLNVADRDLSDDIEFKDLGTRAYKALHRRGIKSFRQLSTFTERDILRTQNLGKRSMPELRELLRERGLAFEVDAAGFERRQIEEWAFQRESGWRAEKARFEQEITILHNAILLASGVTGLQAAMELVKIARDSGETFRALSPIG